VAKPPRQRPRACEGNDFTKFRNEFHIEIKQALTEQEQIEKQRRRACGDNKTNPALLPIKNQDSRILPNKK